MAGNFLRVLSVILTVVDVGGHAGAELRMRRRKFALPTPAGATSSHRNISPSRAGSFAPKGWKSR